MSKSILNRIVVLQSSNIDADRLDLRFVPGFFHLQDSDPVLCISVEMISSNDEISNAISQIQSQLIVDIEIASSSLVVWPDCAETPIIFHGSAIWNYSDYSTMDLKEQIASQSAQTDESQKIVVDLRKRIRTTLGFIDNEIERASRKQKFHGSEDRGYNQQIKLLRSLHRLLGEN